MNISRKAKREILLLFFILAALPLVYLLLFGSGGFLKVGEYRAQMLELRQQNLRLREDVDDLKQRIHYIRTDPSELERLAREKYNLAKPGDVIINLNEPQ